MLPNRSGSYTKWLGMLVVVIIFAMVSGCGGEDKKEKATGGKVQEKEVVAVYEGGEVTKDEFDRYLEVTAFFYPQYETFKEDPAFQEQVLNQFITFEVLYGRVDEQKKKDMESKVNEQMEDFRQMFATQMGVSLEEGLKAKGLTEDDIHFYIERSMIVMADLEDGVEETDVRAEYDNALKENKDAFVTATVSHILVALKDFATNEDIRTKEEALSRAKEVKAKLEAGGDFTALAKEYSDDGGSKETGGTYENADVNLWVPEFKDAALTLPINEISEPVETTYGYHIMKVSERTTKAYDDVKSSFRADLAGQAIAEFIEKELDGIIKENNLPKPPATETQDAPEAPEEPEAAEE